jgi:23S rRNA pseudouridine1911/1915/1917 synthase
MLLRQLTVELKDEGLRIDTFLNKVAGLSSRSFAQKLVKNEKVTVNSNHVKPSYIVKTGDYIEVEIEVEKPFHVEAEDLPLDILYEDSDLLVLNKPRGLVVHPATGNLKGTLVNALLSYCTELSEIGGSIRPGIVHRLDKDTSGALVVAKHDHAHLALAEQLKNRTMVRIYLALVHGSFSVSQGIVNLPIGRDPLNRKKMRVIPNGRPAITYYRVLEKLGPYTLIEAKLGTGRTHQIRVHMYHLKHPIVGDRVYGKRKDPFHLTGQALHAAKLGFIHPRTGQYMEFSAPLPSDFQLAIDYSQQRWPNQE